MIEHIRCTSQLANDLRNRSDTLFDVAGTLGRNSGE